MSQTATTRSPSRITSCRPTGFTRPRARPCRRPVLLARGCTRTAGWVPADAAGTGLIAFHRAAGKVYGSSRTRHDPLSGKEQPDPIIDDDALVLYDQHKGQWRGYQENAGGPTLTNPAQIFAGYGIADNKRVSWGYLDDECDGLVRVVLRLADGSQLAAHAVV